MRRRPPATSHKPQGLFKPGLAWWLVACGLWLRRRLVRVSRASASEGGASAVEYVLLLGGVGLPIMYLVWLLLDVLVANYRIMTYWITLPFP